MQVTSAQSTKQWPPRFQGADSSRLRTSRFSGGGAAALGVAEGVFGWVSANRTREMLVEDFVGFGVVRTVMDLFRGYFYGQDELNTSAARERLVREAGSIFTDNVLSGIVAFGLGAGLDKLYKTNTNRFYSFQSIELFRSLAARSTSREALLGELQQLVAKELAQPVAQVAKELTWEALAKDSTGVAQHLLQQAGRKQFDVMLEGSRFVLPEVLSEIAVLERQAAKVVSKTLAVAAETNLAKTSWQDGVLALIEKTMKVKRWKLACLGVGVVATLLVPILNHWLTRKVDNIDFYPGELGLRFGQQAVAGVNSGTNPFVVTLKISLNTGLAFQPFMKQRREMQVAEKRNQVQEKSFWEKYFPYLAKSAKAGNYGPAFISLLPLTFASGIFDTVNRTFNNPFKKGFGKLLRNAYDFGKGFPFTTQQQMASMFAFLIFSRLTTARGENEFRERLVDSFLGWTLWILGTPMIKRAVAGRLQAKTGSQLLKEVGGKWVLRTEAEIQQLLTGPVKELTLKQSRRIGMWSTLATILLLGVVEPYIAMKWTQKHGVEK